MESPYIPATGEDFEAEALYAIEEHRPAGVILDVRFGEHRDDLFKGLGILGKIVERDPDLPVLMFTQYARGPARDAAVAGSLRHDARVDFVDKLARMGASVTVCDPHRVLVTGPRRLRGIHLESPDIRAGMALVVAGLCAEGTTEIEHAEVIRRGYEKVAQRLTGLGARVVSVP